MSASRSNNLEMVKLLLKYKANSNLINKEGKTAYDLATEYGYTRVLKVLPKIEGNYTFKSRRYNIKKWISDYINWVPEDLFNQMLGYSFLFPPLAILLIGLILAMKIGLPILLIVIAVKKCKKSIKYKKERKL